MNIYWSSTCRSNYYVVELVQRNDAAFFARRAFSTVIFLLRPSTSSPVKKIIFLGDRRAIMFEIFGRL